MPVYRIILFRLKPSTTEQQKQKFIDESYKMKGIVPGIISLELGPATEMSRTKGFDFGIVVCFKSLEYMEGFVKHATHIQLHEMREEMCDDSLAYVFEF